jgi:4-hydroxybenzoate polyprenyltransferase
MTYVKLFLRDIRIEHTFFALPFAYVGAVLGAKGMPAWSQLFWITIAVLGARTAAMAANRYFDRKHDAVNPRTKNRPTASGKLPPQVMLTAIVVGLLLTLLAAAMLNPLCVKLLPIAALGLLAYPLCKRFTWGVHFVLGAVDACAPLGAYVGVTGSISLAALLLAVAVTIWVAGFDIIYALMDYSVDVKEGIRSLPVRFGEKSGRVLPIVLHVLMAAILAGVGVLAHAGGIYYVGVALAVGLAIYEDRLFTLAKNVFVLNERVFTTNMAFSVAFLATTLTGELVR